MNFGNTQSGSSMQRQIHSRPFYTPVVSAESSVDNLGRSSEDSSAATQGVNKQPTTTPQHHNLPDDKKTDNSNTPPAKRFTCNVCNESFGVKSRLQQHSYLHLDMEPFKVELPEPERHVDDGRDLSLIGYDSTIDFTPKEVHSNLLKMVGSPDEATKKEIKRMEFAQQAQRKMSSVDQTHSKDDRRMKGILKKAEHEHDGEKPITDVKAASRDTHVSFPISAFEKLARARNRDQRQSVSRERPSDWSIEDAFRRLSCTPKRNPQKLTSSPPPPMREYVEIVDKQRQQLHQKLPYWTTSCEPQKKQQQEEQQQCRYLSSSSAGTTPSIRHRHHRLSDVQHGMYNPALPSFRNIDHDDCCLSRLPDQHRRHSTQLTLAEFADPEMSSIFRHPSRVFNPDIPHDESTYARDVVRHEKMQESFVKAKDVWANFLDGGDGGGGGGGSCAVDVTAQKRLESYLDEDIMGRNNVHFDGYLLKQFPITEPCGRRRMLVAKPGISSYIEAPVADDILSQFRPNKR